MVGGRNTLSIQIDSEYHLRISASNNNFENKLHWHLDFTFKLDDNKTLNKKALLNFKIITKLCLKILNIVKKEYNISLKKIRYKISLNVEEEINNIFKILAIQKDSFKI